MSIKEKLLTLPKKPGCYLHKDKDGTVIYVCVDLSKYQMEDYDGAI